VSDPGLPLLLTLLSVLALWAFLTTLIVGLLLVVKPLESIRAVLQRIAMGVRAIERETTPIHDLAHRLPGAAAMLREDLDPLARRLRGFEATIEHALPSVRTRLGR
jgi:hypothetical protein